MPRRQFLKSILLALAGALLPRRELRGDDRDKVPGGDPFSTKKIVLAYALAIGVSLAITVIVWAGKSSTRGRMAVDIVMQPASLVFARTSVGGSSDKEVSIQNQSNRPVVIDSVLVRSNCFRLANSRSIPASIPPRSGIDLTVRFEPTKEGECRDNLEISAASSSRRKKFKVELSGRTY